MDALALTALSTAALLVLVPIYLYVAWTYFGAWRGGETIPYFAPTIALILSIPSAAVLVLFVSLCVLIMRLTGQVVLAPGIGLALIVVAVFMPAPPMVWLLRLLVKRP